MAAVVAVAAVAESFFQTLVLHGFDLLKWIYRVILSSRV